MIDVSNIRAAGWHRVVTQLSSPASSDAAFLGLLVRAMAEVSSARQAALFVPNRRDGENVEAHVQFVWPEQARGATAEQAAAELEFPAEAASAARAALESGQSRVFSLDKQDVYYDATNNQGFVLAVPIPDGPWAGASRAPVPAAAVTLLVEPRSKEAVRSTLAMAEVLAGYAHAHGARQALRRTQAASFALDLATRLIASVNGASNFKGAAMQLCNDLLRQFGVDRVALGWVRGDRVRLVAMSDTEHFDRRLAMVQKIEAAMDESLDQEQAVLFPPPSGEGDTGDSVLSQAIVHAHRELAASDAKLKVCSVPLRVDEGVVGVVALETTGDTQLDTAAVELAQAALDLVGPVMRIRHSDDRNLAKRAAVDARKGAAWVVGPKHTAWKVVAVAVFALAMFVTFYHTTYRVGAPATLQPRIKRVVSSPMDGVIKAIGEGVEPGRAVAAGDLLVQLDTTELELSASEAHARISQAESQSQAARQEGKAADAERFELEAERARAQLNTLEHRIARSRIVAPIDGTIMAGELKDRIGSTVTLGDPLLEIAQLDDVIAVARVDESDISLIRRAAEGGEAIGRIATKAYPNERFDVVVERIVPLAAPLEGKNAFEVRARLENPALWMRPGMEGVAKFDTQRHSLLWIGSRRVLDTVRMWLW